MSETNSSIPSVDLNAYFSGVVAAVERPDSGVADLFVIGESNELNESSPSWEQTTSFKDSGDKLASLAVAFFIRLRSSGLLIDVGTTGLLAATGVMDGEVRGGVFGDSVRVTAVPEGSSLARMPHSVAGAGPLTSVSAA